MTALVLVVLAGLLVLDVTLDAFCSHDARQRRRQRDRDRRAMRDALERWRSQRIGEGE